jgi:hypothetical protein
VLTADFNSTMRAKGFAQNAAGEWVKVSSRPLASAPTPAPAKRIRQGEKPPNKLEADWRRHIEAVHPGVKFRAQAIRFRLANGAWYKPDLMAWLNCRVVCWETKGPKQAKNVARGILTIKVAATLWPEVLFILVWRQDGAWKQQEVLP